MKKRNPWLMMLIVVLVMAVLACTCTSSLPGGNNDTNSGNSGNSGDTGNSGDSGNSSDSGDSGDSGSSVERRGFPLVSDAYDIIDTEFSGTVSIVYYTKMSFDEVVSFYKDEIPALGYTLDQDVTAAGNAVLTFSGDSMLTVTVSANPLDASSQVVSVSSLPQ